MEELLAGTVGGTAGIVVGHPLDLIKVRLQSQQLSSTANAGVVRFAGPLDCLLKTVRLEGPLALFKGVGPPIASNVPCQAIVFGTYATLRRALLDAGLAYSQQPLGQVAAAGFGVGVVQSPIMTCSVLDIGCRLMSEADLVKIKMQNQRKRFCAQTQAQHPLYKNSLDCAVQLLREGGARALFKGMHVTFWRDSLGYASWFLAYETLCRTMTPAGADPTALNPARTIMAGGLAGAVSWASIYPLDAIKTRIQASEMKAQSIWHTAVFMYRSEGLLTFLRGLTPTLIRSVPTNAITWLGFESTMALIGHRRMEPAGMVP
eukprot:jgi/Chlat1/4071/Chrsp26S04006